LILSSPGSGGSWGDASASPLSEGDVIGQVEIPLDPALRAAA
jgi:hypothetical protein